MTRIVAFHDSHNASVCEIKNKKIIYVQEAERLDRKKKSFNLEILVKKYENQHIEKIIFANTFSNIKTKLLELFLKKYNVTYDVLENYYEHHFFHACSTYYQSGFNESYVLVADGSGLYFENKGSEIISCYYFKKNKYKIIFKLYKDEKEITHNKKETSINTLSIGNLFNYLKDMYDLKEPGSLMGLSAYSNYEENNLFINQNNHLRLSLTSLYKLKFGMSLKAASSVQKSTEKVLLQYVKNIVKNKKRNLCVSGGVFQNTVANSKILDICPNLYVDPFADDSGLSVGAALFELNKKEFINNKLNSLYLGDPPDYSHFMKYKSKNVNYNDIANIIAEGNIIAIYQGRNELGKRALGNRSFLFDPRDPSGKEKINLLKDREWFRPTAGTVLYEYRNDWFDLKSKDETPFMSYVFKVKNKKDVPAITHVDGTCRVQTLKKEQNFHYYNLIYAFYKITGVPILLNTSFNLSGQPLVNDGFEAAQILISDKNPKMCEYIYLPELGKLYHKDDI